MGVFDTLKSVGKSIWNFAKPVTSGIYDGLKTVDEIVSNPIVQAGIELTNPWAAPLLLGYDISKYAINKFT